MKYQKREKGTKAQRHKGEKKHSVPVCLCASVPDKKGLAPLEITPTSRRSVKSLMGFSFMELMVVVAIMAMLIAASMPLFRNFTRGKNLKEGTNMVVSALRKTRNAAITERKKYRTVFDTVNNAVAIYLSGDDAHPAENWRALPDFVEFKLSLFSVTPDDVENYIATPNIYYLEFESAGGLSSEHDGVPTNKNIGIIETSTEDTKVIQVNKLTGRIKVEE